jgi:hypothetical protein
MGRVQLRVRNLVDCLQMNCLVWSCMTAVWAVRTNAHIFSAQVPEGIWDSDRL